MNPIPNSKESTKDSKESTKESNVSKESTRNTVRRDKKTIEFYFDVTSPWSYIAHKILKRYKFAGYPITVIYKPIFLGGLLNITKNTIISDMIPSRKKFFDEDMKRFAAIADIPFKYPTEFPINTVVAQRILLTLFEEKKYNLAFRLIDKFWDSLWTEDKNISKDEIISSILKGEGMNDDEIKSLKEKISQEETKNKLKQATQEAADRGAFGVPTFFTRSQEGKDELYFGSDRIFMLFRHINLPWFGFRPKTYRSQPKKKYGGQKNSKQSDKEGKSKNKTEQNEPKST